MYRIAKSLKFNPRYVTIIASAVFKRIWSPLTITVTNTGCFISDCFLVKSMYVFFVKSLYIFPSNRCMFFRQIVVCFFFKLFKMEGPKGQLISKCPFGVFKSSKKTAEIFSRISAPASKKWSNQKSSLRESK
jgi:hypothetical protein